MCSGRYNAALPHAAVFRRGDRIMPGATVTDSSNPTTPALPGLISRAIGIITAPTATYAHVVRKPKVAGMLFLASLIIGLAQGLPQLTERGRAAALELQVQQMERFGVTVTDEVYQRMEQQSRSSISAISTIVGTIVFMPFVVVIITLLLWVVFNVLLGGTTTFKHVMAVVAHAQVIPAVGVLFAAPIMYARGVMTNGVANVAALLPMLDETSFLAKFLGMVDLFTIWWVVVLSIGLATLYKKQVSSIATGLFVFYGIIALVIAYFTAG
jgi:hypothetical protein